MNSPLPPLFFLLLRAIPKSPEVCPSSGRQSYCEKTVLPPSPPLSFFLLPLPSSSRLGTKENYSRLEAGPPFLFPFSLLSNSELGLPLFVKSLSLIIKEIEIYSLILLRCCVALSLLSPFCSSTLLLPEVRRTFFLAHSHFSLLSPSSDIFFPLRSFSPLREGKEEKTFLTRIDFFSFSSSLLPLLFQSPFF